jgi:hypothetical protein
MPFIGNKPSAVPLTSADIADGIITSAKIVDGTIANADINSSAAIALSKLSTTGTASSANFLRGDGAWSEAGAQAGQVIQVVTATDSTVRSTSSTSFVTASNTLSVTITPSSSSNKILILVSSGFSCSMDNAFFTIYRGATDLGTTTNNRGFISTYGGAVGAEASVGINYLDSPSTTSATTYQVYFRSLSATTSNINVNNSKGSITCLEIKG